MRELPKWYNGDYVFKKWIFRWAILCMILFVFALWFRRGLGNPLERKLYVHCPLNVASCENPLYDAKDFCMDKLGADHPLCSMRYLPAGFVYGSPPDKLVLNGGLVMFGLVVLAFVLNHFLYNRGRKFWSEGGKDGDV